jgi:hypothetical protein
VSRKKAPAETVFDWLAGNLGDRALAPLTGQDSRALAAAAQIMELYSYDPSDEVLKAFALVAQRMQPTTIELAYHCIAQALNWEDRAHMWAEAGLPPFLTISVCKFEPKNTRSPGFAHDERKATT